MMRGMRLGLLLLVLPVFLCACGQGESEKSASPPAPEQPPAAVPAPAVADRPIAPEGAAVKGVEAGQATPAAAAQPAMQSASQAELLALANKSGCLACHSVEKKIVGPAWQDVAQRYHGRAEARAQLIAKVKQGGKGNWTEVTGGIAMPPNAPRVSDQDIERLVDFVLSLAK